VRDSFARIECTKRIRFGKHEEPFSTGATGPPAETPLAVRPISLSSDGHVGDEQIRRVRTDPISESRPSRRQNILWPETCISPTANRQPDEVGPSLIAANRHSSKVSLPR
jgi:hypothetical protein